MKVAIRVDAALHIGSGHVMRCKTLADELRRYGAEILFVCREHPGNLISLLRDCGHETIGLPALVVRAQMNGVSDDPYRHWLCTTHVEDAMQTLEILEDFRPDWLVVDHYGIDAAWERLLRPHVGGILVIDDLANRVHDCDLLLDQNLYMDMDDRYAGLTPPNSRLLLGPQHALLRHEFRKFRDIRREWDAKVRRIFVFFGGVDRTQQTEKALDAIEQLNRPDITVDIVVGANNLRAEAIRLRCGEIGNSCFHLQIPNMAELMACADLAIGSGGSASWERCAVGLPAILISTAENQQETTAALMRAGAVWYLGWHESVTAAMLTGVVQHALEQPEVLQTMSRKAFDVMGGSGCDGVKVLSDIMLAGVDMENV